MRNLKVLVCGFVAVTALTLALAGLAQPQLAIAAPQDAICAGIGSASGSSGCADDPADTGVNDVLRTVVNILSIILGIAAVIMIIIGGLKYVTSGGDSSKTASAKNTIIYALIGLVVALLAQVLVHFVIDRFTNSGRSSSSNGSVNLCRVDSLGNYSSNPDPSRPCAMP